MMKNILQEHISAHHTIPKTAIARIMIGRSDHFFTIRSYILMKMFYFFLEIYRKKKSVCFVDISFF